MAWFLSISKGSDVPAHECVNFLTMTYIGFLQTGGCASVGVRTSTDADVLASGVSGDGYARWSSKFCELRASLNAIIHPEP